jgi:hypothetical protein
VERIRGVRRKKNSIKEEGREEELKEAREEKMNRNQ